MFIHCFCRNDLLWPPIHSTQRYSSWWITPLPRIRGGFFHRIWFQNLDNMECSWLSNTDLNNLSVILHILYLHIVNQKSNVLLNLEDETERASLFILLWSIQVLYIMHHILLSPQTILSLARFSLRHILRRLFPGSIRNCSEEWCHSSTIIILALSFCKASSCQIKASFWSFYFPTPNHQFFFL